MAFSQPRTHRLAGVLLVAVGLLGVAVLHAQQPVVFVHGLKSNGGTWDAAAARLNQELDVQTFQPTQSWWAPFEQQGIELETHPEIGTLPESTIAFGHSNGGIVAREWSKWHPLTGIATIGTPHQGAPLVNHIYEWLRFTSASEFYDTNILMSFESGHNEHLHWVLNALLGGGMGWARWFRGYMAYEALVLAGIDPSAPVLGEMRVPSAYLSTLNGDGNLAREEAIPYRVGIVSVPANFWLGGPLRLAVPPEYADEAGVGLHAAAAALFYFGSYVQSDVDWSDPFGWMDANEKSNWLMQLGEWINEIDLTWCSLVSSAGPINGGACIPNDSLVSWQSQLYPGGMNVGFNGVAHNFETRYSGDAIYWVLHYVMGVQPPPPPPPPPPLSPDRTDILRPYQVLTADQWIVSPNGRFRLYYQSDGNLVATRDLYWAFWATGTNMGNPGQVAMQGDGNLVMTDGGGTVQWTSNTWGNPGAFVAMQDDGNIVIYRADGVPIWATGTHGE